MTLLSLLLAPVVATALILALLALTPRLGLLDRPSSRKDHSRPTPLVGGPPLLACAWFLPWLFGLPLPDLALYGAALITLVGIFDDRLGEGFPWTVKLTGQTLAGLLLGMGLFPESPWAWLPCLLWAGLLQNAVNFQDNANGLCSGSCLIMMGLLLVLPGGGSLTVPLAGCAAGALVPLLLFNFPRGRIFLGDQGALLLGYTLAALTLAPSLPDGHLDWPRLLVPFLPLCDLAVTLLYRHRRGLSLVRADHNHLFHRLRRCGADPVSAVLVLWLGTLVLGTLLPLLAEAIR